MPSAEAGQVRPLESLLLLQSVASNGTSQDTFEKAADFLRHCDFFADDDSDRVSPSYLQDLFLVLLKQRAKQELLNALDKDSARSTRALSPSKRKVTSPKIASIEDARSHAHLIPKMVPEFYDRYRQQIINDIKADEEAYDSLLKELHAVSQAQPAEDVSLKPPSSNVASSAAASRQATPSRHASIALEAPDSKSPSKRPTPTPASSEREHKRPATKAEPAAVEEIKSAAKPNGKHHLEPPRTSRSSSRAQSPLKSSADSQDNASQPSPAAKSAAHASAVDNGSPRQPPPSKDPSRTLQPSLPSQPHLPNPQVPGQAYPPYPPVPYNAPRHSAAQPSPQRGGVMLQPFQVTPQAPRNAQSAEADKSTATSTQKPSSAVPRPLEKLSTSLPPTPSSSTATSGRQTRGQALPHLRQHIDAVQSPGSSTMWKRQSGGSNIPDEIVQRGFSPISDEDATPTAETATRKTRRSQLLSASTPAGSKSGSVRSFRARSSKTPSIAGTLTHGRTRSQSVSSYAEGTSVATPAADSDTAGQDPDTPSIGPEHGRSTKRKQGVEDDSSTFVPQIRPDHIIGWRNFNRMCQPLMDNIQSHRLATIFANPVKADSYSEIIKRPQDLKSIRQAITAGTRAVNAAAAAADASADSPGVLSSSGSTVTLPISADYMPPKAIVNADQLEQELLRMFANAVMFNPGYEGIVKDTTAMFGDVQQAIDQWRTSDIGDDEQATDESQQRGPSSTKRRRI